jgi:hypothetical protein
LAYFQIPRYIAFVDSLAENAERANSQECPVAKHRGLLGPRALPLQASAIGRQSRPLCASERAGGGTQTAEVQHVIVAISSVDAEAMVGRTSGGIGTSVPTVSGADQTARSRAQESRKAKSAAPKIAGTICGTVKGLEVAPAEADRRVQTDMRE